jgi:Gpi18-like mannosyltransferase
MSLYRKRPLLVLSIALLTLSSILRFAIKDMENLDTLKIGIWYGYLYNNGWKQLADGDFSNYPPAYLYILWASTFLDDITGRLVALKIIPTLFDIPSAYLIYLIARLKHPAGDMPYLLAAVFFSLPTIMFNSTGWGQIDSCYTCFLILCVYLLLRERPAATAAAFGTAFSFKAQSIFLLPFLGVMLLKGKMRWQHFLLIPFVYLLLAIPSVLIGRNWASILTIYIDQAGQFHKLSFYAPNLYIFIPHEFYNTGFLVGMIIFFTGMALWGWINWRTNDSPDAGKITFMAFASLALVPFLLPKMHERYFYPADVFSFIAAIFMPEIWLLPILYQISSGISYLVFIAGVPVVVIMFGATINIVSTIQIVKKQMEILHKTRIKPIWKTENDF